VRRRSAAAALAALVALACAPAGGAAGWRDFYKFSERPSAPAGGGTGTLAPESVCIAEILAAQERHAIPNNLLLGLGLQEAGTRHEGGLTVWPYAVNAEGRGKLFDTPAEAMGFVRAQQAQGISLIDVGCMQINLRWHPHAFGSLEEGFNPRRNVDYAARFLRGLYEEAGSWRLAVGNYHSRTPDKHDIYLERAERNIIVANQQIDRFRRLAALSPAAPSASPPASAAPPAADGGPLWSTAKAEGGGWRSPYSRRPMQPILPALTWER
jgi:hypothetical protein